MVVPTNKPRIAFQGEIGAYSEQAALYYFGAEILLHPVPAFKALFAAIENGEADAAMVPIENSLAGSVYENYDLLLAHKLPITGETYLAIRHHLLALPGVKKSDIRRVLSHPQALGQCKAYLDAWPGIEIVPGYDTAGSAKSVRMQNLHDTAAIASRQAAAEYDLHILDSDIASNRENYTRFLVLQKQAAPPETGGKTSIVYAMKDIPGALFKSLAVFALRELNLLKIESRPLHGKPFDYFFYLDFEGSIREETTQKALSHLEEITTFLQVLGSYEKADRKHF